MHVYLEGNPLRSMTRMSRSAALGPKPMHVFSDVSSILVRTAYSPVHMNRIAALNWFNVHSKKAGKCNSVRRARDLSMLTWDSLRKATTVKMIQSCTRAFPCNLHVKTSAIVALWFSNFLLPWRFPFIKHLFAGRHFSSVHWNIKIKPLKYIFASLHASAIFNHRAVNGAVALWGVCVNG